MFISKQGIIGLSSWGSVLLHWELLRRRRCARNYCAGAVVLAGRRGAVERNLWKRILIGFTAPAILILLCIYEYQGGSGMECMFYRYTGLYCPGCGSGRAVSALFHGRFAEAVTYNILLPILGIPCLIVLAHEYLRFVLPGMKLRPVSISQRTAAMLAAAIVAFWILRNVPAFSILAP